jgi:hypothetical protein
LGTNLAPKWPLLASRPRWKGVLGPPQAFALSRERIFWSRVSGFAIQLRNYWGILLPDLGVVR